jgi:hydroxypyruvate isomerase
MLLSACIEWIFQEEHDDVCERVRAAGRAGLGAVEFHQWRNKPLDELERVLGETGLRLTSFIVEPRCLLVDIKAQEAMLTAVRESVAVARRLKVPAVVLASGPILPDVPRVTQHQAIVANLKAAAPLAEDAGVTLILEPLNTRVDHPGLYLDSTVEGLDIIEEVGRPGVRLLYDMYHSTAMGEVPDQVLGNRGHLVGHVQIADSPGRHEPGSGTIPWAQYLATLSAKGYTGPIGLEYRPTGGSLESIQRTYRSLGVQDGR